MSPRSTPPGADQEREPRHRASTLTASGGRPRAVLAARRAPAASPVVPAPPADARATARTHAQPSGDATGSPSQRLARVAGAVISREPDRGLETIDFAPPAHQPPTASLLSPALSVTAGGAPGAGAMADPAPFETAATPNALASAGSGALPAAPAPDIDDLYEQVVERLRRDLLCERERMGDLLGDLP